MNPQVVAEDGQEVEGYMWSYANFKQYLRGATGGDEALSKIASRMRVRQTSGVPQFLPCASRVLCRRILQSGL